MQKLFDRLVWPFCSAWLVGWFLVIWSLNLEFLDAWLVFGIGAGVLFSLFLMVRGLLKRKPHITYASLHAICWLAWMGAAFFINAIDNTWINSNDILIFITPLVCSIILFILLQPILTILSKIQIVVHSDPKGASQDPSAYEQAYQTMTMQPEYRHPDEMYQKTERGRYYAED